MSPLPHCTINNTPLAEFASADNVNATPSPSENNNNQQVVGRVCTENRSLIPGGTQKLPMAREMSTGDANGMEITKNNPPNLNGGEVFVGRCMLLGTTVFLQPKDILYGKLNIKLRKH